MKRKHETADCANYELLKAFAKRSRTHSTQAESILWEALRGNQLGCKFRRQHIIGNYIADFACIRFKLVVEIDGGYHLQGNQPLMDAERTADLKVVVLPSCVSQTNRCFTVFHSSSLKYSNH